MARNAAGKLLVDIPISDIEVATAATAVSVMLRYRAANLRRRLNMMILLSHVGINQSKVPCLAP